MDDHSFRPPGLDRIGHGAGAVERAGEVRRIRPPPSPLEPSIVIIGRASSSLDADDLAKLVHAGLVPIDLEGIVLVADSGAEVALPVEASPLQPRRYLAITIPLLASAAPGPLFNRSYGITTLGTWRIQPVSTRERRTRIRCTNST